MEGFFVLLDADCYDFIRLIITTMQLIENHDQFLI